MVAKPVEVILKEKKIYQITNPKLVQASPDITLQQAIDLMDTSRSGYVVIAKNKKVVGIFTETDVVRKVLGLKVDWNRPVSDFMTENPVVLSPKDSVGKAIREMGEHRFYHIPLVDEKKELVNVLSVRTLIRFLSEFYPTEIFNLPPNPAQIMETPEGG